MMRFRVGKQIRTIRMRAIVAMDVFHQLQIAGIFPGSVSASALNSKKLNADCAEDSESFGEITALLQGLWEGTEERPLWLEQWRGLLFFVGCDTSLESCRSALGPRLVWRSAKPTRCLGVVSSRLGRKPDSMSVWFRTLRSACAQAVERGEMILTGQGTTTEPFVHRCQELFGVPTCELKVSANSCLRDWFHEELPAATTKADQLIHISPSLERNASVTLPEVAEIDRAVAAISDRLVALSVRKGGNWHKLLRWRLDRTRLGRGTTFFAIEDSLTPKSVGNELFVQGAVGWTCVPGGVDSATAMRGRPGSVKSSVDRTQRFQPRIVLPTNSGFLRDWCERNEYLTHCTRRRYGPWPGQTKAEYIDDLILARDDANHSALAALNRIIRMQCLLATNDSSPTKIPVASFTEVPLDELQRLRVFRPHRGRWDFEPYGLCIRKDWLVHQQARPVHYAPRSEWSMLSDSERVFFQLQTTTTRAGNQIDWTVEQEWRVVGDVRLDSLLPEDAVVFVPSESEASLVTDACRWPVVTLSSIQASQEEMSPQRAPN